LNQKGIVNIAGNINELGSIDKSGVSKFAADSNIYVTENSRKGVGYLSKTSLKGCHPRLRRRNIKVF
jgi:hypothetical protein